ncbi:unnamed protein product, partial [Mesorhabditis belari]|uniref:Uncharacterized protein n=1 Tax=Mesorhabditis belari TaxID=2138241 RepID=A0AAF3FNW5_9BILA
MLESASSRVNSTNTEGTNFLFIGGLIMAVSVEKCDLHKGVALRCSVSSAVNRVGIMAGFTGLSPRYISSRLACGKNGHRVLCCRFVHGEYGAGTGTATGTPSNLAMLGQLTNLPRRGRRSVELHLVDFFAVPLMLKAPGEDGTSQRCFTKDMSNCRVTMMVRRDYAWRLRCLVTNICSNTVSREHLRADRRHFGARGPEIHPAQLMLPTTLAC